ncbi:MAG: AraC family transcriptional regulator [Pseudomonadota bacterium]
MHDGLPTVSANARSRILPCLDEQMPPPGFIRLGIAREIPSVLSEFGVDSCGVIREVGLDPGLFEDADSVISHRTLGRLLSLSVARTRSDHFGLLVGRRATILSLGIIGRLMQHSDTVGDALQALVANSGLHSRGTASSLVVGNGMAMFSFSAYHPSVGSADQTSDAALATAINVLRTLCGADWRPTEIFLPRTMPASLKPYRLHFQAPVRFNHETATILFPDDCLEQRIAGADPMLRAILEDRIRLMRDRLGSGFSDDLRRLLRTRITSKRCSAIEIAGLLAVHRRTLTRRLKRSGLGFRTMTNEVRFEIARQLLEDTQISLTEIAAILGYSEASAFTRAFRRWSGQTPISWRSDGRRGALS